MNIKNCIRHCHDGEKKMGYAQLTIGLVKPIFLNGTQRERTIRFYKLAEEMLTKLRREYEARTFDGVFPIIAQDPISREVAEIDFQLNSVPVTQLRCNTLKIPVMTTYYDVPDQKPV